MTQIVTWVKLDSVKEKILRGDIIFLNEVNSGVLEFIDKCIVWCTYGKQSVKRWRYCPVKKYGGFGYIEILTTKGHRMDWKLGWWAWKIENHETGERKMFRMTDERFREKYKYNAEERCYETSMAST